MDAVTGEHWAIEIQASSPDMAKERAHQQGYKVLRIKEKGMAEGAKVDRMVKHIEKSEKKLGKSEKEAENIAWATANKRGMLDNKNKKA
jgi:cobalamin biosynthesis Co2+ chelatase CbiK